MKPKILANPYSSKEIVAEYKREAVNLDKKIRRIDGKIKEIREKIKSH